MKTMIFLMAFMSSVMSGGVGSEESTIDFISLPYTEGMLYVSVSAGDNDILRKRIEVDEDRISIPIDFKAYYGMELGLKAFQDLNDNGRLDLDNYGRPTEPCLQTNFTPVIESGRYEFKLIEY